MPQTLDPLTAQYSPDTKGDFSTAPRIAHQGDDSLVTGADHIDAVDGEDQIALQQSAISVSGSLRNNRIK